MTTVDKNPDEWFTELALLRLQLEVDFKHTISEEDMISHILYNISPTEYDNTLEILKIQMEQASPPDLEDVKEKNCKKYEVIMSIKSNGKRGDEHEEQVLATKVGGKFFKGNCHICGQKGHKSSECWENSKNAEKRPDWYKPGNAAGNQENKTNENKTHETRTCNYCKKVGHLVKDCHKLKNKKKREETADVLLINYEENFPIEVTTDSLLTTIEKNEQKCQPCISVADSAASSHMTSSLDGMFDLEDYQVPVTVGNKMKLYSEKRGKYKGLVTQANGTTMEMGLKNVLYVPGLLYNLFSITKAIEHPSVSLSSE